MATIAVQEVGDGLADVAFVAANAGGDDVPSGIQNANFGLDPVVLLVANGDAASHTITVQGLSPVVVAAGDTAAIPVNRGVYPGSLVPVTYDGVTSVTVAAIKL